MSIREVAHSIALVGVLLLLGCGNPSDRELVDHFQRHRTEFSTLVEMIKESPGVALITTSSVTPKDSLSSERWAEFVELMERLDVERGVAIWGPNGPIDFRISGRGLATGGDWKGLSYLERPPVRLYDSLDVRPPDIESNVPIYRKIDDRWYLVYVWDD